MIAVHFRASYDRFDPVVRLVFGRPPQLPGPTPGTPQANLVGGANGLGYHIPSGLTARWLR